MLFSYAKKMLTKEIIIKPCFYMSRCHSTLTDSFGRFHNYLRISLTEKCNLRCVYCMPMEGVSLTPKNKLFTLEETKQVISLFAELGVTKLRFTGGEPTVSKHLIPLVQYSRSLPTIQSIGITTNGILLHNQLDALQAAGLTHVNISLDTLQPARFAKIVRRDQKLLYKVLSTVFAAVTKGLSVKINCVVMRGVNVDELISFLDLTREMKVDVRFLEMMPFDDNNWDSKSLVSFFEMIDIIRQQGYEVQKQPPVDPHDTTKWYSVRSRRRAGHDPEREREREEEEDGDGDGDTEL